MKRIALLLLAVFSVIGTARAGKNNEPAKKNTPAQETKDESLPGTYRYLPSAYGNQAAFTQADLIALRFTAYNARTQRIGSRLVSLSLQADARPESLVVSCFCELVEKEKTSYLGDGKFAYPVADLPAMMQDGVDFILALVKLYYPDINDRFLCINLYMKGSLVGSWKQGKLAVLATGK
jgi:hypothetical protein